MPSSDVLKIFTWPSGGFRFVLGKVPASRFQPLDISLPPLVLEGVRRRDELPTLRGLVPSDRHRPRSKTDFDVDQLSLDSLEEVAEFEYRPTSCKKTYRMVVVRKNLSIEQGERRLFDEVRYFFYITNDRSMTQAEVVQMAVGTTGAEPAATGADRELILRSQAGETAAFGELAVLGQFHQRGQVACPYPGMYNLFT